ncbi:lysophospholipid acyltransferase family protein [Pelistega suis]|uniref:Lysophospholipid acyltransferase family protein n=1 Tax=Pelistega suis TaxID=1631957 RepID=A0A849P899_9BURK|nr:lysophospholipid acyltransferase family protein [Pelistega suis]MCQ9329342.1 lysophospholipid acyltransferase family protein [Pelistega suis]NOL52524.1 lysophospholipid acyltransferase family protein [Pelistega suis]
MVWLLKFWSILPLGFLQAIGRGLGWLVYKLSPRYGRRLRHNAAQAGFTDAEFHNEAAKQIGAMFAEIPKVWFNGKACLAKTRVANPDYLEALRANEGQSVIFITPHLGCFEICARYLAQQKPITVMYRKARREFFEPVMKSARDDSGMESVPADFSGVRSFLKVLRQGGDIGLLPDQVPASADGEWVTFFDRMAYTITLPGKLAAQTKAKIVMVVGIRLSHAEGWELVFKDGPEVAELTPNEQAQAINHALEEMIRLAPTQYLWSYNRYKVPKLAPPMPQKV